MNIYREEKERERETKTKSSFHFPHALNIKHLFKIITKKSIIIILATHK
jgi:hypothetical protein